MITALACSLAGQQQRVRIRAGTRAVELYGASEVTENYYCSYGVNPAYQERLERAGMRVTGVGDAGEVRIIELADHPFFLATLFIPQVRSEAEAPHPLLAGYAAAVRAHASG